MRNLTVYGGLLSIVIYSLGLMYFLYLMVMWQTKQILPSVTNQSIYNPNLRNQQLTSHLFEFSVEIDEVSEQLNSIVNRGDLYTTSVYSNDLNNGKTELTQNVPTYNCNNIKTQRDYFDPICMNLNEEDQTKLNANSQSRDVDTYIQFYVNRCNPVLNSNCLSLQDQSTIFNLVDFQWRLTLYSQDVDLQTGTIINIPQDHYFTSLEYQNASSYLFDLKIRYAKFIIDTGMFFASIQEIKIVQSIQLTVTQNHVIDHVSDQPALAHLSYSLDREESIVRVTHVKIGQILAELGAIIQILLFSGIIMYHFNDTIMNTHIEEALLKIYFPQIGVFKFIYDLRGRIRQIQYKDKILQNQDFESVKDFRVTTGKELRQKLNHFSILHDISRLQIKLQQTDSDKDIIQLQGLGYKMNLLENLSSQFNEEDYFLEYQDFLNINHKKLQPIQIKFDIANVKIDQKSDHPPDICLNIQNIFYERFIFKQVSQLRLRYKKVVLNRQKIIIYLFHFKLDTPLQMSEQDQPINNNHINFYESPVAEKISIG